MPSSRAAPASEGGTASPTAEVTAADERQEQLRAIASDLLYWKDGLKVLRQAQLPKWRGYFKWQIEAKIEALQTEYAKLRAECCQTGRINHAVMDRCHQAQKCFRGPEKNTAGAASRLLPPFHSRARLPGAALRRGSAPGGQPRGRTLASSQRKGGGAETILLVEDDPDIQTLLTEVLREYGFTILVAGDGEEGVVCLSSMLLPSLW